jgi:hypothetical protein
MAEIAIPLLALGSMYVMSNQEKKKLKEGYSNMGGGTTNYSAVKNELPYVNPHQPAINYPVTMPVTDDNVKKYPKSTQPMDKYFNTKNYGKVEVQNATQYGVGGSVQQNYSLTGKPFEIDQFKHNNMVPFFWSKSERRYSQSRCVRRSFRQYYGCGLTTI